MRVLTALGGNGINVGMNNETGPGVKHHYEVEQFSDGSWIPVGGPFLFKDMARDFIQARFRKPEEARIVSVQTTRTEVF